MHSPNPWPAAAFIQPFCRNPRALVFINSKSKQTNKQKILQSKKVTNTGLKSSLGVIDIFPGLPAFYLKIHVCFPKSSGTVPTFHSKIQWRGWHRALSFNNQVHTTLHPVLQFLGICMGPVNNLPCLSMVRSCIKLPCVLQGESSSLQVSFTPTLHSGMAVALHCVTLETTVASSQGPPPQPRIQANNEATSPHPD